MTSQLTPEILLEQRIKKRTGRVTQQRILICRALLESSDHPDAILLYERIRSRSPRTSRATVYRTLTALCETNLVLKHDFGDGRARYELNDEISHDHLFDIETGKVIDFQNSEFDLIKRKIAQSFGYKVSNYSVFICVKKDK